MINTCIAIFASGSGTNAKEVLSYFKGHASIKIGLIVTNNPDAGVLSVAQMFNVPALIIEKIKDYESNDLLDILQEKMISHIVLAGFMRKIPDKLIDLFPDKIINIHPSLLPKYGGKGMYGIYVHQAVVDNGEQETGITIHLVNSVYDEGRILFQAKCPVSIDENAVSLAKKVQQLEHLHYPQVIEKHVLYGA